ncbi:hypothetical protein OH76DRAFT_1406947 [Lentinus brumalis]|uniref:Uncharacterized protein n=1 Tax=Lentinus brumalis TaxID=2498619 RepID=A0A371D1L6_9APHY|nr:hypothetical protein OH76DRAFT_1406947 [Polyporus brumalis]
MSDGFYAASAFVRHLSKLSGVHLELQFPLSLKYHYVAAVCDTNNMFTKRVKKERVTELDRLVKEQYGPDHGLRWWWDRDWTHPRNGHDPSWRFSRVYTGDAEGQEYDSDPEEAEEQEKSLEREEHSQGAS